MSHIHDTSIFHELSEYIFLRLKHFLKVSKSEDWMEYKTQNEYNLWIVTSGNIHITSGGIEQIARVGDAVLYYPKIPYRAASANLLPCSFIYLRFDFQIGAQARILDDFPFSGVISSELARTELQLIIDSYKEYMEEPQAPGAHLHLKSCLLLFLSKIIHYYSIGRYLGAFSHAQSKFRSHQSLDLLQPVFRYIQNNLHKPLGIRELSELIGFSEKYFITYFKQALGITPGQYIYQVKMNRAKDLIYQGKYSVKEISQLLGYNDPYTFSKAFKKYYHVSPSKFV